MYLQRRHMYSQLLFICLNILCLLFLTIFLQNRLFYQVLRPKVNASHPSTTEPSFSPKTTHQLSTTFINISTHIHSSLIHRTTASSKDGGMWTVYPMGRLGNQMGEYATLYALAKLSGHQAYIYPVMYKNLAPIFHISLPVIPTEVINKINWRDIQMHDWMSEDYLHIEDKYVRLIGFVSSYTFYHHIRQEILQEFTFHDHIKADANQDLLSLCKQCQNMIYVGVHVRRGDYGDLMPLKQNGVVADSGYLETAMNYFREKYSNAIFVVTSNGMEWCKEHIDASKGDVYFAGNRQESSPWRDFVLLAHCNHTIMTIGTFGMWAGYLAGGETIYLANYTLPEATFLPEWIGISAYHYPLLIPPPSPIPPLRLKSRSKNLNQKRANLCVMKKLWKGLCRK